MATADETNLTVEAELQACRSVGTFLDDKTFITDDHLNQIAVGTFSRARDTPSSISGLVENGHPRQAAMLCRPLFEDMVVAHWLVLNQPDPDFLIARFFDHVDAMRLNQHETQTRHQWDEPMDVSDLAGREQELKDKFGRHAQYDWWGIKPDGSRLSLPELLDILAESDRFKPRFRGDTPVLHETYATVHKWTTWQLHHTAVGLPLVLDREGGVPAEVPDPPARTVLWHSYWMLAQLGYLMHDLQDWNYDDFENVFLHGLFKVFGAGVFPPQAWQGPPPRRYSLN